MTTSVVEIEIPTALSVKAAGESLTVNLSDGRSITVPLEWFPRLLHGTPAERGRWTLIGRGLGIHWEDLDEDISVESLLAGKPSGEGQESFSRWLKARAARPPARRRAR